ncbi:MAG: PTS sugar transporter subunit IIA [Coriobacteriaceae bacterium]|nr:PTS sugar transporter subunit IIA [Coriobacteriaceae bacterium]
MGALRFDATLTRVFDAEMLTTYEVEEELALLLQNAGYVKASYAKAIHEREKVFPTGLEVPGGLSVAVPHCDIEHVNRGALCVGVLKRPVDWRRMDAAELTCPVSLVVMLALDEAHAHMEMLQKTIALIQDQELVRRIIACDTPSEAYDLLTGKLV